MDAVAGGGSQTIPSDLSVSFSTFQLYLLSVPLRSLSLSLRPTSRSWIQITDAPPTPVAREYTTECAAVRGQTEASGEDELPLVTTRRIWRRSRARMRSRRRVRCSRCPARSAALGARLDQLASRCCELFRFRRSRYCIPDTAGPKWESPEAIWLSSRSGRMRPLNIQKLIILMSYSVTDAHPLRL